MRNQALLHDTSDVFDLWETFPRWINRHHPGDGERSYVAKEIDASFNASPTLTVEMSGRSGLIATYKCNIVEIHNHRKSWLVFAPLIVIWEQGRAERGPDLGRIMMEHVVSSIRAFCVEYGAWSHDILITSGNLTVAKGGKPFFEGIGWEIVYPGTHEPSALYNGNFAMAEPLAAVEARIEAAVAPLREAGKIDAEPISFAILRLTKDDSHPAT